MKKVKKSVALLLCFLLAASSLFQCAFAETTSAETPQNLVFYGTGKTDKALAATNSWEYRATGTDGTGNLLKMTNWDSGSTKPEIQKNCEIGNYARAVAAVSDAADGIDNNKGNYVVAAKIKKSAADQKVRLGVAVEYGNLGRIVLEVDASDKISSKEFSEVKIPLKDIIKRENFSLYTKIDTTTGEMSGLKETDDISGIFNYRPVVGISIATPVIAGSAQNSVSYEYLALEYDPYNAIPVDENIIVSASHKGGNIVLNWTKPDGDVKDYIINSDEVVKTTTANNSLEVWEKDTNLHKYCLQVRNSSGAVVSKSKDFYIGRSPESVATDEIKVVYISKDESGNYVMNADNAGYANCWDDRPDNNVAGGQYLPFGGSLYQGYVGIGGAWKGGYSDAEVGKIARAYIKLASSSNHIAYENALDSVLSVNMAKNSDSQKDLYLGVLMQKADGDKFVMEKDFVDKFETTKKNVEISMSDILNLANATAYKSIDPTVSVTENELKSSKIIGVTIGFKVEKDANEEGKFLLKTASYDNISIVGGRAIDANSAKFAGDETNTTVVWSDVEGAEGYFVKMEGSIATTTLPVYSGAKDEEITVYPYFKNGKIGLGTKLTLSSENAAKGNIVITQKNQIGEIGKNFKASVILNSASDSKAKLVIAVYKNGMLSAVDIKETDVKATGAVLNGELDTSDYSADNSEIKVFVWESSNLTPVVEF